MIPRLLRSLPIRIAAVATVLAVAAGLYWFQPWKLAVDRTVAETLAAVPPAAANSPAPAASQAPAASPIPAEGPVVELAGEFISHEHETRGLARVIRHPDGSRVLELAGLDTSNGPDLRVWLADQPVLPGTKGWHVFDDGQWLELGRLKGNKGDQTYAVPPGTDLDRLTSVTIWCKRFAVSFGAAALTSR